MSLFKLLYSDLSVFTQSLCIKDIYSRNFRCSAKGAVILFFSWSTLYLVFSNCVVSSFYLFYLNLSLFTQIVCVKDICSRNFRCSAKGAVILFVSWSTLYIVFSICVVSSFYCSILICHYLPKVYVEKTYSWNFRCSTKEAVILLPSWTPLYMIFPRCRVLILGVFYFDFQLFTRSACVKVTFFWNFRCSAKDAVILLRLWSTTYIAFLKCKVSWFYFFYFNFQLLTESAHVKVNFSWNLSAPRKTQWYCFARGAPCI